MGANSVSTSATASLPMRIASVSLAYFSTQMLAFQFPDTFGLVAAIWPAAGIALAALLLSPRCHWVPLLGCLFIAGLAANLTTQRPVIASVGFMVANICETAASAWLITRWCGDQVRFARVREVLALMAASILVNAVTAIIGAEVARLVIGSAFWSFYATWWVADGLGLLLITPLIVVWVDAWPRLAGLRWHRMIRALVLLGLGCAVAWFSFGQEQTVGHVEVRPYLLLMFIVWSALRHGRRSTVTLLGALAMIAVGCTAAGLGRFPLGGVDVPLRLLAVQVFLGVMGVTGLLLAAVVAEQRDAQLRLGESEARFQSFMRELPGGAFIKNHAGRYQFMSLGMRELLGLGAQDQIDRTVAELLAPEAARAVEASDEEILATMTPASFELALTAGGQRRIFLVHKFPMAQPRREPLLGGIVLDITERKQVEAAGRASEEQYRTLFESAADTIVIHDAEGRILSVNPAACEMYGYTPAEFTAMTVVRLNTPAYATQVPVRLTRIITEGSLQFETDHQRKDGTPLSVEVKARRINWQGQSVIMGIIRDVSDRKRAEKALRREEAFRRSVIERATEGMCVCHSVAEFPCVRFTVWNERMTSLTGYTMEEINQRGWYQTLYSDPDYQQKATARMAQMRVGVDMRSEEWEITRADGQKRTVAISTTGLEEQAGVTHILALMTDVTERKQAETALRESEARFRTIIESSPMALAITDEQGNITLLNQQFRATFGYTLAEIPTLAEWWPRACPDPAYRQRIAKGWQAAAEKAHREGTALELGDYKVSCKDGSVRNIYFSLAPMGTSNVVILHDITERKRAEQEKDDAIRYVETILAASPIGILTYKATGQTISANAAAAKMLGTTIEILKQQNFRHLDSWKASGFLKAAELALASGQEELLEGPVATSFGVELWAAGRFVPFLHGEELHLLLLVRDISRHKRAEAVLRGLNRQLRAITSCNQASLRATEEQALLDDICQILCAEAGYRLAWIGYGEADAAKTVRPVAWAGVEDGYVTTANLTWADTERGRGPTGTAIRCGTIVYIQNFSTDPRMALWCEPALDRGYGSSIALPLKNESGDTFGAFTLYAGQPNAFTPDEIRLLEGLAGDLAFGINALRARTERHRGEVALRESEANFRTFFESMDDMIMVGTRDGRILFTNSAVTRTLGYSAEELAALHMLELHPADKRREAEDIFTAMFQGERESCPLPLARKDGGLVPVETRVWFGRWNGQDCIFGIVKNLTAEQEAQQRFERLFRNNPTLMALSSLPGRQFSDVNDAFLKTLGYSRGDIIGKTTEDLALFVHAELHAALADKLQADGRIANFELQVRRQDGAILDGLFSGEVISSQGRQHFLTVMVDITDRKQAEAALRDSLAEKTTLLQEVHHRVKNNLQIISSLLNLQADQVQDAAVLELLAVTRNRVGAMALLHENLYQSESLARLNLPEYVKSLCAQLLRAAGPIRARVQLECHVEPGTISLELDQAVPCGLLLNELVTNALKHAFPGERSGCIRVTLERATPQTVGLTVADDGAGLPVTLDPSATSSLGLQLVSLLTQQLHGTVNFERGQGTAVHILFPNSAETEPAHE